MSGKDSGSAKESVKNNGISKDLRLIAKDPDYFYKAVRFRKQAVYGRERDLLLRYWRMYHER